MATRPDRSTPQMAGKASWSTLDIKIAAHCIACSRPFYWVYHADSSPCGLLPHTDMRHTTTCRRLDFTPASRSSSFSSSFDFLSSLSSLTSSSSSEQPRQPSSSSKQLPLCPCNKRAPRPQLPLLSDSSDAVQPQDPWVHVSKAELQRWTEQILACSVSFSGLQESPESLQGSSGSDSVTAGATSVERAREEREKGKGKGKGKEKGRMEEVEEDKPRCHQERRSSGSNSQNSRSENSNSPSIRPKTRNTTTDTHRRTTSASSHCFLGPTVAEAAAPAAAAAAEARAEATTNAGLQPLLPLIQNKNSRDSPYRPRGPFSYEQTERSLPIRSRSNTEDDNNKAKLQQQASQSQEMMTNSHKENQEQYKSRLVNNEKIGEASASASTTPQPNKASINPAVNPHVNPTKEPTPSDLEAAEAESRRLRGLKILRDVGLRPGAVERMGREGEVQNTTPSPYNTISDSIERGTGVSKGNIWTSKKWWSISGYGNDVGEERGYDMCD